MHDSVSNLRLTRKAEQFIGSVLSTRPQIAVFDCDGTLWSGDGGKDFLFWEIENQVLPPERSAWIGPRYLSYEVGKVSEEQMCGEMVTVHAGMKVIEVRRAAKAFFASVLEPRIFSEMRALTRCLAETGCELWAVSSSSQWLVEIGAARFGISANHALAAAVEEDHGTVTDRLIRVPTGPGKVQAMETAIGRPIDLCLGNSIHDADMLRIAKNAVAVEPNPDLERIARELCWTIYRPEAAVAAGG